MAEGFLESIGTAELVKLKYDEGYNAGYSSGYSRGYSAGQSAASGTISRYSLSASGWSQRSFTSTGQAEVDAQILFYRELSIRSSASSVIVCGVTNMDYTLQYGSSAYSISTATQGIYGISNGAKGLHYWPSVWSSTGLNPPANLTYRNFHPKLVKGDVIGLTVSVNKTDTPYLRGTGWLVIEFTTSSRLRCFLTNSPSVGDSGSALKTYLSYLQIFAI